MPNSAHTHAHSQSNTDQFAVTFGTLRLHIPRAFIIYIYVIEQGNTTRPKQLKLPSFCCPLWNSATKWGGISYLFATASVPVSPMCDSAYYYYHLGEREKATMQNMHEVVLTVRTVRGADGLVKLTISWMARRSFSRCSGLLMPISCCISWSDNADIMAPLLTLAWQAATYHAGMLTHN